MGANLVHSVAVLNAEFLRSLQHLLVRPSLNLNGILPQKQSNGNADFLFEDIFHISAYQSILLIPMFLSLEANNYVSTKWLEINCVTRSLLCSRFESVVSSWSDLWCLVENVDFWCWGARATNNGDANKGDTTVRQLRSGERGKVNTCWLGMAKKICRFVRQFMEHATIFSDFKLKNIWVCDFHIDVYARNCFWIVILDKLTRTVYIFLTERWKVIEY